MDKYKIKDYTERLKKETFKNAQKMLYMWVKQDVISLNEYRTLVKNIEVMPCCTELNTDEKEQHFNNGFAQGYNDATNDILSSI